MKTRMFYLVLSIGLIFGLATNVQASEQKSTEKDCHCGDTPKRFSFLTTKTPAEKPEGMVWIPGGSFMMGGDNHQARSDELPKHKVFIEGFWMDQTEVTNAQFKKFIDATDYITTAEKKPDWNELKKQLPPGTPQPDDNVLVPASLVFTPPDHAVTLKNSSQWWSWVSGANWQHPYGPQSSIAKKNDYPVVHISWEDAKTYCEWAGKRLPMEAEWEWAARGGLKNNLYPWGNEHVDQGRLKTNTWQGEFPHNNTNRDGFLRSARVKSFEPNDYDLYDMAGNVWEWTADYYHYEYYSKVNLPEGVRNISGPAKSYDPREPNAVKRVIRGGSYLCNESYCSGYRVAARMKTTPDTSMEHVGFRCVKR